MPVPDATRPQDPLYGYGLVDAEAAISASIPTVTENPMGDLAEWIRVYRRAETEPQPEPTVTPVAIPPLPAADAPTEPGSPLLPSPDSLRYGTLPLIALTVPGILIALGVTAAARRISDSQSWPCTSAMCLTINSEETSRTCMANSDCPRYAAASLILFS
nr:hypothetical protein [Microbacterium barkeri]